MTLSSNSNSTDRIIIPANAEWRYQVDNSSPVAHWHQTNFNDANWSRGKAGFGYGDGDDRTQLKFMRGRFDSVRIRHNFMLLDGIGSDGIKSNSNESDHINFNNIKNLFLYIRFDDAFIAYLNGHEIARSGVSDVNGERLVELHEAKKFEKFLITNASRFLLKGINVLSIEGFNQSLKSSDFSLHPVLTTEAVKHPGLPLSLTNEERVADLNYLQQRMEDQSSYLSLQKFDHHQAFKQLRDHIDKQSGLQFARDLQKIIAQIGDTHAEVKLNLDAENDRYLPFIIADSTDGYIAIQADRSSFLEEKHPIIKSIDGKPIEYWLKIASKYVAHASPQLIRYRSLRVLRSIDRIRTDDGVASTPFIDLTLQSFDGSRQIERRYKTSKKRLSSGKVVLGDSQILAGNIAYLRIPSMRESGVDDVLSDMAMFRDTDGLIIDVRGNYGGRYDILHALYGYFMAESTPPYVTNISAYRLSSTFEYEHLHYRSTYRLKFPGWTTAAKKAIKNSIANFKPEWQLPKGKFSAWHFTLLGRSGDARQYHYQKPVTVLLDAASFSASDGFLSAFADLPNVSLIGQPSSGGSGATRKFRLPNSGIEIALSSMASFRPNGKLFEGNGIEADILVKPTPGDFLGRSDKVLDEALKWIRQVR